MKGPENASPHSSEKDFESWSEWIVITNSLWKFQVIFKIFNIVVQLWYTIRFCYLYPWKWVTKPLNVIANLFCWFESVWTTVVKVSCTTDEVETSCVSLAVDGIVERYEYGITRSVKQRRVSDQLAIVGATFRLVRLCAKSNFRN